MFDITDSTSFVYPTQPYLRCIKLNRIFMMTIYLWIGIYFKNQGLCKSKVTVAVYIIQKIIPQNISKALHILIKCYKKRGTLTWISYTWAMWNWTVGTKRGTDQPQKSFSNGNTAFKSDIRPNIKPAFFVFTVSAWALISLWVYRHREGRILACPLCTSSMSLLPVCKATHGWIQSCSFPGNWSLRQDGNGKMKNLIEEILLFPIKTSLKKTTNIAVRC